MSDYHDYNENLAFPPQGDWSDIEPKNNTDRTASTIELVEKIEKLSKQLDIAIKCLRKYSDITNWFNIYKQNSLDECPLSHHNKWIEDYGYKLADEALEKIEVLK